MCEVRGAKACLCEVRCKCEVGGVLYGFFDKVFLKPLIKAFILFAWSYNW